MNQTAIPDVVARRRRPRKTQAVIFPSPRGPGGKRARRSTGAAWQRRRFFSSLWQYGRLNYCELFVIGYTEADRAPSLFKNPDWDLKEVYLSFRRSSDGERPSGSSRSVHRNILDMSDSFKDGGMGIIQKN